MNNSIKGDMEMNSNTKALILLDAARLLLTAGSDEMTRLASPLLIAAGDITKDYTEGPIEKIYKQFGRLDTFPGTKYISIIKYYREITGFGLKESKEFIDKNFRFNRNC